MNKLFKYDDVKCGGFELVEFFNDVGEKFVEECENKIEEEV